MTKPLAGKTSIITGASSGIGLAIAQAFAEAGSDVVIVARGAAKLRQVAQALGAYGGKVTEVVADLTKDDDIARVFAAVSHLDVLVNNAGASIRARTENVTPAQWRSVIDLNVTAAFLCAQAAYRKMLDQGGGRIINIGSVASRVSRPHTVAYTTSKFALDGMTRAMALDGRGHGIAVSILHPGNTDSGIWAGQEEAVAKEGLMPGAQVARAALLMATLPPGINMLDATILPLTMPFLGRG
ncbi:MAG: SDR family oxidoreductase [Acidocella sp.]|nr:SDR family oxidoreductase [Acidocella sp.]